MQVIISVCRIPKNSQTGLPIILNFSHFPTSGLHRPQGNVDEVVNLQHVHGLYFENQTWSWSLLAASRASLTVRFTVKNGDPPEHGKREFLEVRN